MKVYCAFCRCERAIPNHRHMNYLDLFIVLGLSLGIASVFFAPKYEYAGIIAAAGFAIMEGARTMAWRMAIVCQNCHFDPVLYLKHRDQALKKVTEKLEQDEKDPMSMGFTKGRLPRRKIPIDPRSV